MSKISQEVDHSRFQILSMDGGGIKGVFSAAVLADLEEDLGIDVTDHFDLIAGTSTGGIIALCLGLGIRPRQILEFYVQHGHEVFPKLIGLKSIQHWVTRKYSSKPLVRSLKSCFGELKLGDSRKRLVIPSYNIGEDDVYIFRTAHHERLRRDYRVEAWKIAKATSAAPTFFACAREIGGVRLVDGGVWANNPSMVAVVEAYGTLNVPLPSIRLLSIGCLEDVTRRRKSLDSAGILGWARGNSAIEIILRGQSTAVNNQVRFLLGSDRVLRLNPDVPANEFSLDGIRKAGDLIAKAAHFSRTISPAFRETFSTHIAPTFNPFHQNKEPGPIERS